MRKSLGILLLVPAFLASQDFFVQDKTLDVPYVPTPPEVVAEMLKMADVGRNDVLYDLGCGDGRIVITAALMHGTRGVGIDLNPVRIKESKDNAAKAGVDHLVSFFEQDLFQADLHEATVVSLYLLSSVNLRLRPILFGQLRPGTRVVSHDFSMDDWESDKLSILDVNNLSHRVYYWIIPANVSGLWEWPWPGSSRGSAGRLELWQRFQKLTGRMILGGSEIPLGDLAIAGDVLRFSVSLGEGGKLAKFDFEGRVSGDHISGTMAVPGPKGPEKKAWRASRGAGTMKPIDASFRP